jgi:hypothetical protein
VRLLQRLYFVVLMLYWQWLMPQKSTKSANDFASIFVLVAGSLQLTKNRILIAATLAVFFSFPAAAQSRRQQDHSAQLQSADGDRKSFARNTRLVISVWRLIGILRQV